MRRVRSQFLGPVFRLVPLVRDRGVAVVTLTLAAALIVPAAAEARIAYTHAGQFGGTGIAGEPGLFHNTIMPQRMAVHEASGKLLVADRGNHRVQVFSPTISGAEFAFQIGVPSPIGIAVDQVSGDLYVTQPAAAARNELQVIQLATATSGTYTLTFGGDTTAPIAYNATAATVQTELRALPSIGGANVNVTGPAGNDTLRARNVTFVGTLAATDVSQIAANASGLNPEAQVTVRTGLEGGSAAPAQIRKLNPDDANDPTAYSPDATFVSPTVGAGQQIGGLQSGPNDMANGGGITVDPTTGDILVADTGKNLVQRFDSDGAYLDDFNGATGGRPAFAGIRDVAVTSTGDVVVADVASAQGRIDRFDGDGDLQATLSQNNVPVANPNIGMASYNWAIALAVNQADEVLASSVTTGPFTPSSSQSRLFHFENDVHVNDFAAPANAAGPIYGIATASEPGRLYAMVAHQLPGLVGQGIPRVQAFDAAVPPAVSIDPVSDVTATGAKFSGSVDPNGTPTTFRFEYRGVSAGEWRRAPVPDGGPLEGGDALPVSVTVADLDPNAEYEVRLVAAASTGVTAMSAAPNPTFTTDPAPAAVTLGDASFISESGATVAGGVNPRNSSTTYWFEYGLDETYGSVAPAAPASAGAGNARVTARAPLADLEPGTTYHYKLVAENEFGLESESGDGTFTTLASAPDDLGAARAWELPFRLPTNGVLPEPGTASEDGNRYLYKSAHTHAHYPWVDDTYSAFRTVRGDRGWDVAPVDLPFPTGFGQLVAPSLDMSRVVAHDRTDGRDPDDQNGAIDLYLREPNDELIWISRSRLVPPGEPQLDGAATTTTGSPKASSMSVDGRTVVFSTRRRLIEEDPNPSGTADSDNRLYKWADGELSLVSVDPGGAALRGVKLGDERNSPHAVSRDGQSVVWTQGSKIYRSSAGSPTVEIGTGRYADATPDGSRVFYFQAGRLFGFEAGSQTVNDLSGPAGVLGVAAVAEEGTRVYFVATGVLGSGSSPFGEAPAAGANNLYFVELDSAGEAVRTRFVTTLGAADPVTGDGNVWTNEWELRAASTSPDGQVMTFGSIEPLAGKPTAGARQAYVYDATSHSLACASCPANGDPPATGGVNEYLTPLEGDNGRPTAGWASPYGYYRLVATDGRVFFSTRTALTSDDENEVRDVYEYRNGHLRLVSRGGPRDRAAEFVGAARDGSTVFFLTPEALVREDDEPSIRKLYAARIGGGFPDRSPQTPPCDGDGCQGPNAPSPPSPAMGSAGLAGSGNVSSPARTPRAALAVSKVRAIAGSSAKVTVRVPGAGRIAVTGRQVRPSGRRVSRRGTFAVRVALNERARRRLSKRTNRGLTVRLRISYRAVRGGSASKRLSITFKRSKATRAKGPREDR